MEKERLDKTVLITNDIEEYSMQFITRNFEIDKVDYITNKISAYYVDDPYPFDFLYRRITDRKPTEDDINRMGKLRLSRKTDKEAEEAIEQFRKNPEDFPHLIDELELSKKWLKGYEKRYGIKTKIVNDYDIYDYQSMIRCLYTLINQEKKDGYRVLINFNADSSTFVAACVTVSMFIDNIKFVTGYRTVVTETERKKGQSNADYYIEYSKNTKDVVDVFNNIRMKMPISEIDLKRMKVFESIELRDRTNTNVVKNLINMGLWFDQYIDSDGTISLEGTSYEDGIEEEERRLRKRKEENQFKRKLVDGWKIWIEPDDDHRERYKLKPEAEMYVKLFCPEEFEFTEYERYNKKLKIFEEKKVKVKKQWDPRK